MVSGWGEKSAGLKILWVWTLGTAAILITNVVRTRLHDMDKLLRREEEAQAAAPAPAPAPASSASPSDTILKDDH
ncbi:hypothetical protein LUZ63_012659 [Rhynchospora breviuscula]|uniref:Uncharacterized protein n=1 Tax=Rhynchospora breviuscula TaxID=2022672 RepID=A0A9Q0CL43_9POAL|nr:hypothetical protein LUZ63_012659 [Rhynchospora breviuscula]